MHNFKEFQDLNEEQLGCVLFPLDKGPVLLIAGPGSGKTHTITKRLHFLIQFCHILPSNILLLTFTKDAAAEMCKRIPDNYNVKQGTFHSIFFSILYPYLIKEGNHDVTWMTKHQQVKLLQKAINAKFTDTDLNTFPYEAFLEAMSFYKNTFSLKKLQSSLLDAMTNEEILSLIHTYDKLRRKELYMTYDDILWDCYDYLQKNSSLSARFKKQYKYVIVDEFQDINAIQYEVLKALCFPEIPLLVVGDDDQAIYGFRGSTPDYMKIYELEFNATVLYLQKNYRSCKAIVKAANQIIDVNENRFQKKLLAVTAEQGRVNTIGCISMEQELEYIRRTYEDLLKNPTILKTAVLVRTNTLLEKYKKYFLRNHIPIQGNDNREHNETMLPEYVTLFIELVRMLYGSFRMTSFDFVFRRLFPAYPLHRISGDVNALERIPLYVFQELPFLEELLYLKRKQFSFYIVCSRLSMLEPVREYFRRITNEKHISAEEIDVFIHHILECGKLYQKYNETTMLELIQDMKRIYYELQERRESQKITLTTIHGAKGLEYDYVIIPDCNEGNIPSRSAHSRDEIEEECRIFYVGVTRAKKRLDLLYIKSHHKSKRPSRFLKPILQQAHQIHIHQDTDQKHL